MNATDDIHGTGGTRKAIHLSRANPLHFTEMHQSKFVDPMKTTNTAQYAALAANNSCRRAFVSIDIAAANKSVKTMRTPIAANILSVVLSVESRYILSTGAASSKKITVVMMRLTSLATRDGEK